MIKKKLNWGLKRKSTWIRLAILSIILIGVSWGGWKTMLQMPGESYRDALLPLTVEEQQLAQ